MATWDCGGLGPVRSGQKRRGEDQPGRQCLPRRSEKEEPVPQDFSPGREEKPCCFALSLEEWKAVASLLAFPPPYKGPPFPPMVLKMAVGALLEQSVNQTCALRLF